MVGWVNAFEEAGLLRELVGVLDYVDSTLLSKIIEPAKAIVDKRPSDDWRRPMPLNNDKYRGHVGKVMDHVCMELRSLLYEALGGE
jgi:hypothetical protein